MQIKQFTTTTTTTTTTTIWKHAVWSICSSKWSKIKFTLVCRWFDHPIKIQNRITKLFKHSIFILQNMDAKSQSEETKNNAGFQKRKSVDINFNMGNEPIEIVQEYTNLGTRLTLTGNFTLALEYWKEKVLHAFSSVRKHALLNSLNPNTASQIFDTVIVPIISYNSEIWGVYTNRILKHGIVPQ